MGEVRIRVPEHLQMFLKPAGRASDVQVANDSTSTIGHLIEAVGIPLTEIDKIMADGEAVPASQHLPHGSRVQLRPVARPQALPTQTRGFVLDVHLGTLARRMRLLGIDTAYRNDAADDELVEQANTERRVLLTRDRRLLMRRALWCGAHVRGHRPDTQLADVVDRFAPRIVPWTRCTACNGELQAVRKDDIAHLLEPGTRRSYATFARCQVCAKIYWRGAHSPALEAIVAGTNT